MTNQNLLRAGPQPEIRDVDGTAVAPQRFFDIGAVGQDDPRGLEPDRLVMSADWEEHVACGGILGSKARAEKRGKGDTFVYRSAVSAAETAVRFQGMELLPEVWHWPETENEAHSHIVLPEKTTPGGRRVVRASLQLAFVPVDTTDPGR